MRRFGFGDGAWIDAHLMGRIRSSPPPLITPTGRNTITGLASADNVR